MRRINRCRKKNNHQKKLTSSFHLLHSYDHDCWIVRKVISFLRTSVATIERVSSQLHLEPRCYSTVHLLRKIRRIKAAFSAYSTFLLTEEGKNAKICFQNFVLEKVRADWNWRGLNLSNSNRSMFARNDLLVLKENEITFRTMLLLNSLLPPSLRYHIYIVFFIEIIPNLLYGENIRRERTKSLLSYSFLTRQRNLTL